MWLQALHISAFLLVAVVALRRPRPRSADGAGRADPFVARLDAALFVAARQILPLWTASPCL